MAFDTKGNIGVDKQWTGLLEWWNSGMVDWIISSLFVMYLFYSLWQIFFTPFV